MAERRYEVDIHKGRWFWRGYVYRPFSFPSTGRTRLIGTGHYRSRDKVLREAERLAARYDAFIASYKAPIKETVVLDVEITA